MPDRGKLQKLIGKPLGDVGGALVLVGDKLGLYKTLAEAGAGPLSADELAARTGTCATCANGAPLKPRPGT
jgi:hypothetical protein